MLALPSADNKAGHQEDEKSDSPCDGHSQNGGLVGVPNGQDIYSIEKANTVVY